MNRTENNDAAKQFSTHPEFQSSATWHAIMVMENDGDIMKASEPLRRFDGTVSSNDWRELFNEFAVIDTLPEWTVGSVNFEVLAEFLNYSDDQTRGTVPDDVRQALICAERTDTHIRLSKQLDRKVYVKVDQILQALGGKWKKGDQAHFFAKGNAQDALENYLTTGKIDLVKPPKFGFFPTPKEIGAVLVEEAGIKADSLVLEPQGGSAALLQLIANYVPLEQIQTYEIQEHLCDALKSMGYRAIHADFLSVVPEPIYDVVVLNPPFEQQHDIDHVLHAYQFLVDGGRLNAIMSYSTIFRNNKKSVAFRKFLEDLHATIEELPDKAFKESGTMVKTIKVKLVKDAQKNVQVPAITATSTPVTGAKPKKVKSENPVQSKRIVTTSEEAKPIQPLTRKPTADDQIAFDFI